ncbi:hypothetical protein D3C87_1464210 [compost metagenome]
MVRHVNRPKFDVKLKARSAWKADILERPALAILCGPRLDPFDRFQDLAVGQAGTQDTQLFQVVGEHGQASLRRKHHAELFVFLADELQPVV